MLCQKFPIGVATLRQEYQTVYKVNLCHKVPEKPPGDFQKVHALKIIRFLRGRGAVELNGRLFVVDEQAVRFYAPKICFDPSELGNVWDVLQLPVVTF